MANRPAPANRNKTSEYKLNKLKRPKTKGSEDKMVRSSSVKKFLQKYSQGMR
jgi:hypothetical protein